MLKKGLPVIFCLLLLISLLGFNISKRKNITAASTDPAFIAWKPYAYTPVIDPGHGSPDGGTTSVSGINESEINLAVSLKAEVLMRFLGLKPVMTRDKDSLINDGGESSIREKKVADQKNRVKLINGVENGVLISIHQNFFEQSRYRGAQVFYSGSENKAFADIMQKTLRTVLDPQNERTSKHTDSVYLLNKVIKPAVLIECGFLSNSDEEALLRSEEYQRKIAIAMCKGLLLYTNNI